MFAPGAALSESLAKPLVMAKLGMAWLSAYLVPFLNEMHEKQTGPNGGLIDLGPNSQNLRIYLSTTWACFYIENYSYVLLKFFISFWELGPWTGNSVLGEKSHIWGWINTGWESAWDSDLVHQRTWTNILIYGPKRSDEREPHNRGMMNDKKLMFGHKVHVYMICEISNAGLKCAHACIWTYFILGYLRESKSYSMPHISSRVILK